MGYRVVQMGASRSFPIEHAFLTNSEESGEGAVVIGVGAGKACSEFDKFGNCAFLAVELGTECLGVHTGEAKGQEGSNILGFARFRLGESDPSNLIELVCQPNTSRDALAAGREVFESAGLVVAVCGDFPGRIVDRLVRPYYNAALRRLDERLASAADMDTTLRLGLGYPEGPIALLERTGLSHHYEVSQLLFEALGDTAYSPARRAQVAHSRTRSDVT